MTPYFWREMSALIQNFTCDITTLPWQRSVPKWHKKKKDNFKQQGGFLPGGGGALGYFSGGYVPPGTSNWHPVLKKISPEIDTPF